MRKGKSLFCAVIATVMLVLNGFSMVTTQLTFHGKMEGEHNDRTNSTTKSTQLEKHNEVKQESACEKVDNTENIETTFTDAKGHAIFTEETNAALQEFKAELMDLLENYSSEETVTEETGQLEDDTYLAKRLIVKSAEEFDTYGAVAVADGYRDYTVLQYETEEAAKEAYAKLTEDDAVAFVEADTMLKTADDASLTVSGSENGKRSGTYLTSALNVKLTFDSWGGNVVNAEKFNRLLAAEKEQLPVVVVAVLDTGMDYSHPLFENRVIRNDVNYSGQGGKDDVYSYNPHGTAVAGIVADLTLDNVLIKPYKVMRENGKGYETAVCIGWLQAIEDQVDVINLSLGGSGNSELLEEMAALSEEAEIPVVVAAGNDSGDTADYTPANIESCITVSGINKNYELDVKSNSGSEVDLTAPGSDIRIAQNDGTYKEASGTSYAAPHITAALAMLYSYNEDMSSKEAYGNLINHATDLGDEGIDKNYGYGLLNMNFTQMADVVEKPVILTKSGSYEEAVEVELFSKNGDDIYYYFEGVSKPIKYTKPFVLTQSENVVAYCEEGGIKSERVSSVFYVGDMALESECVITEDGTLTAYRVEQARVELPETIQGVTVTAVKANMPYVEELVLPETVQSVFCFTNSKMLNLKSIEVAEDNPYLKAIDGVLYDKAVTRVILCPSYKEGDLVLPDTVTCIDNAAFFWSELSSLTVPDGLEEIKDAAFWYCKFEKLHLPATVRTIAGGSLQSADDRGIHEITMDKANPYFTVEDGVLYTKDKTRLLYYGRNKKNTEYTIADTVTEIDAAAFVDNPYLVKLTVPESLELVEWIMVDRTCTAFTDIYFMGNMPYRIALLIRFGVMTTGNDPFGDVDTVTIHYLKGAYGFDEIVGSGGIFGDYTLDYKRVEEDTVYENQIIEAQVTIKELEYNGGAYSENGNSKTVGVLFNKKTGTVVEATSADDWYNYSRLVIPKTIQGVQVSGIGRSAFKDTKRLVRLELPDSITKIDNSAFVNCNKLLEVNLPEKLTYIGDSAFEGCQELTPSVNKGRSLLVLPKKVTYIGNKAFKGTQYFQIVIPDGVEYIGDEAFCDYYGYYLCAACFQGKIPYIGEKAFGKQSQGILCCYETITESEKEEINGYSWKLIPKDYDLNTIKEIEYKDEATGMTYVYHPITRSLGASLRNEKLTALTIPSAVSGYPVMALENNLLLNMNNLEKITVPDCIEKLEFYALSLYKEGYVVEFMGKAPAMLAKETFGNYKEYGDKIEIWYHKDEVGYNRGYWTYWNTLPYSENRYIDYEVDGQDATLRLDTYTDELSLLKGMPQELVVPDNISGYPVKSIAYKGFYGCTSLKKITLPDSVTRIGNSAFAKCSGLQSIHMSSAVTDIGERAFLECSALTAIEIPDEVTELKEFTFYSCQELATVKLPKHLKEIGQNAFYGCSKLQSIDFPDTLQTINGYAFYSCTALTRIEWSDNLSAIGSNAFARCKGLTKLELPDSITSIGSSAFVTCSSLTDVKLPSKLQKLNTKTFSECTSLMKIMVPVSVTRIESKALGYKSNSEILSGFAVYGYSDNDTAAVYAQENGLDYVDLGNYKEENPLITLSQDTTTLTVASKVTYTGLALTPEVTVMYNGKTLAADKDYSVAYFDNVEPGEAYVVIQGRGDYTGTVTETFQIVAKENTVVRVSGSIVWEDNSNAQKDRPEYVLLKLYADGKLKKSQIVRGGDGDCWSYTFDNLPNKANGTEIVYTMEQMQLEAYTTVVDGTTIRNVYESNPETKPDTGNKPEDGTGTTPDEGKDDEIGDMDGDGLVTLADVQIILKAALRIEGVEDEARADVDEDYKITLQDAQIVLMKALHVTK